MRVETKMIKQLDLCCDVYTAVGNARLVNKVNEIVDVLNRITAVHNISDVKPEKICKWQHYKLPTGYEHCVTECGNDVSYITKLDYCPFCGGRIEITGGLTMNYQEAIDTLQDIHDVAETRIKSGDARGVYTSTTID